MTRPLSALALRALAFGVVAAIVSLSSSVAQTAPAPLASQVPDAAEVATPSDDDIWEQLQSLSGTQAEDKLWDAAEEATERVFGRKLERKTGETVFQTLEAAADGDWRNAFETAGPELLSAYLPGVGQYVDLIKSAAGQIDRVTDQWAQQLYDHESYKWVGAQVDARVAAMNGPMLDDYGDPFYGRINDGDEAFMPSYSLPDGSPEKERARQFEASLFQRFLQQPFYDELVATNWTSDGGGLSGLFKNSYAAMIREELGYQPKPRRLFNHFYHRYTRDRLERYFEVHEYVEAELMRRKAQAQKEGLINAYRSVLKEDALSAETVLRAYFDNDRDTVSRALDAGFDPNVTTELEGHTLPFMFWAGHGLEDAALQPLFDQLVAAGGDVRPELPDGTTDLVLHAIAEDDENFALRLLNAGFPTGVDSVENPRVILALAISKDMPRVVSRLIEMDHDPNARDASGHTHLIRAIKDRYYNAADALIDGGADINARATSEPNAAAIHLAALQNHAEMVPRLVSAGAQIDSRLSEKKPFTPLMIAAMEGHFETVRALVDAGADVEIEATSGTAATYARNKGHDEVAVYLEGLESGPPALTAQVSELVKPGFTVEVVLMMDGAWRRPLEFSIESDTPDVIDTDVSELSDSDVYQSNDPELNGRLYSQAWLTAQSEGVTDLTMTVSDASGQTETVTKRVIVGDGYSAYRGRLVEAARAYDPQAIRDVISEINEMDTALGNDPSWLSQVFREDCARGTYQDCQAYLGSFIAFHVAGTRDEALLDFMLEWGADANYTTSSGDTILTNAAAAGNLGQVERLLDAGADPNLAPNGVAPALVRALRLERIDIATELLDAGANPDIDLDGQGLTLLHVAAAWNDLNLINALLSAGARIQSDNEGRPPGHISYWAHDDLQLALRLGYDEAREYEERERNRNAPGFDWNEFAHRMQPILEEGAAEMAAIQSQHDRRVREIERDYDDGMSRARRQDRSQRQPYTPSTSSSNTPDSRSAERENESRSVNDPIQIVKNRNTASSAPSSDRLPECEGQKIYAFAYFSEFDFASISGYSSECRDTYSDATNPSRQYTVPVSACEQIIYIEERHAPSNRGASRVSLRKAASEANDGKLVEKVECR